MILFALAAVTRRGDLGHSQTIHHLGRAMLAKFLIFKSSFPAVAGVCITGAANS